MANEDSYSRGLKSIQEVVAYVEPLALWMEKNKPSCKQLTLKGPDYDLLKRWPKAAAMMHVFQGPEGDLVYRGFALARDKKPARYPQKAA
jgi:hypothetical protein